MRRAASVIAARVGGFGGEAAADVAVPAEDLVVGGDDPRLARRELELDARAAQLAADDPLLDDAAAREPLEVVGERDAGRVQAHRVDALADPAQLAARAGPRQPAQLDDRVAVAGHAGVELDDDLREPRPDGAQARDRGDDVRAARDVLDAERVRDAGAREQLAPAALGARGPRAPGRRRGPGSRARGRARTRAPCSRTGRDTASACRGSPSGSASAASGARAASPTSGRIDGSSAEIIVQPRAGVLAVGQQRQVVVDDRLGDG